MKIDLKHILSLPPDKRDDEIRKLLPPKQGKHRWSRNYYQGGLRWCTKCKEWLDPQKHSPCPIPLDWELAMKMRDEIRGEEWPFGKWEAFRKAVLQMYKILEPEKSARGIKKLGNSDFTDVVLGWLALSAQPRHYILTALKAKEITDEQRSD